MSSAIAKRKDESTRDWAMRLARGRKSDKGAIARQEQRHQVERHTGYVAGTVGAGIAGALDGAAGDIKVPFIDVEVPPSLPAAAAGAILGEWTGVRAVTDASVGVVHGHAYFQARKRSEQWMEGSEAAADEAPA